MWVRLLNKASKVSSHWVNDDNAALLTDLYELAMLQAYYDQGMEGTAVFDLFIRRLPPAQPSQRVRP